MCLFNLRMILCLGLERFLAGRYTSVGDDLNVVGGLQFRHPYKLVCLSVKVFIKGGREIGRVGGDREGQTVFVLFASVTRCDVIAAIFDRPRIQAMLTMRLPLE